MIICSRCKQKKPFDSFGVANKHSSGYQRYCKPCKAHWNTTIRRPRKYGITIEIVEELVAIQENKCIICFIGCPEVIDHDHNTGKVRGILCHACNKALGMFRDDSNIIRRAADYIDKHSGIV